MHSPLLESDAIVRARPLLGTVVEIRVPGTGARASVDAAIDAAFAEMAAVQRLMSRHDADSDLMRLNRAACGHAISVDPRTAAVLRWATRLYRDSGGLFDVAAGSLSPDRRRGPGWSLCAPHRALRTQPVSLDLDGIAKGYAVDRAVATLRRAGLRGYTVNAGGDLRCHPPRRPRDDARALTLEVRLPGAAAALTLDAIPRAAVATTARFPAAQAALDLSPGSVVDPRTGREVRRAVSVTVSARTCLIADALTKVVVIDAHAARPCLDRYSASAWIVDLSRPEPVVRQRMPREGRRAPLPAGRVHAPA